MKGRGQIDPTPEKTTLKKPSLIRVKNKNLHEYSSVQTPLNIIHQYIFLDNQNPERAL